MKISSFADVGLRVVLVLSAAEVEVKLTSEQLAVAVGVPRNHVSKTITKLGEIGILDVVRGRNGGVRLSEMGRKATVGFALRALESSVDLAVCQSEHTTCPLIGDCQLRLVLRAAQEEFLRSLDHVVISTLPTRGQMGPVFETIGLRPML